jgi:CDP-6-deoxy-D-xylo-4-hexulose-3-dehydrase
VYAPTQFEKAWSKWLGCQYSLFVSSGSTANFLLVAAVKEKYALSAGSKVLVPACTWVTNVAPIMQLGLEPVFCDVELSTFSFDLAHMEQLRQVHGDEIRAVFVTHLLGLNANVEAYKALFPNAIFMEDICESHGVTDDRGMKRGAGSSVGATFSFYYGHHMTTIEGGMVSTNDADLYELMRLKRSHGMARELSTPAAFASACVQYPAIDPRFLFLTDGYNFRNTDLGAQLGLSQLSKLDASVRIRQENHAAFVKVLQPYDAYFFAPSAAPTNSSFCLPFICKSRTLYVSLKAAMEEAGIETRPVVGGNLLRQPFLKHHAHVPTTNADLLNEQGFYIGNSQFVTVAQVHALQFIIQLCVDSLSA